MNIDITITINELISALSFAMDIEDRSKRYHSWRTAAVFANISTTLKPQARRSLFYAAMLHDIGGTGLSQFTLHDFINAKKDNLIPIIGHAEASAQIVAKIPSLEFTAQAIAQHHENYDGSGYPNELKGDEISFEGQLIHLADVIDVFLRTQEDKSIENVIKYIKSLEGSFFSKEIVDLAAIELDSINVHLWQGLCDLKTLPEVFSLTRDLIGPVVVPHDIDVIGLALDVFSQVIDAKHTYTTGHSRRVSQYAVDIAKELDFEHDRLTELKWAGLLHDVGKLSVPLQILDKSCKLTDLEYKQIKHHAAYSYDIIRMISDLAHIAPIAAGHHERIDGNGYPMKLKGDQIPFPTRILCVSDAFDALTSGRPYQTPLKLEQILGIFQRNAGTQFDADVVAKALPYFEEKMASETIIVQA